MLSFGAYQAQFQGNYGQVQNSQFQSTDGYLACEQDNGMQNQQRRTSTSGLPLTPPGSPRDNLVICQSPQKSLRVRSFSSVDSNGDDCFANSNASIQPMNHSSNGFMNLYPTSTNVFNFKPGIPDGRSSAPICLEPKRNRNEKKPVPDMMKDEKYFERRKRNNLAAKRSRDARKSREDQIAARAAFLEKDNAVLRAQVATLQEEAQNLRILLFQKRQSSSQLESSQSFCM